MRVITLNLNGIRAAARKGFYAWLQQQNADVICLQETKAQMAVLQDEMFFPSDYHCYYMDAEKKGYSGVGLYCKQEPQDIKMGLGWGIADREGRYLQADFDGYSVASIYIPSGSSSEQRQEVKFDFLARYMQQLKQLQQQRREYIICGDWNIAHKQCDIKNWRGNQKNSGFLPEERAWLDKLFDKVGYADAFREVEQEPDQYTWWSNRGQAWAKNVGWRIDYQVLSPGLRGTVQSTSIYKDERFSDHAPLTIDYAI